MHNPETLVLSSSIGPAQMVEQPNTPSEKDGRQVHVYLAEQPGSDALLRDAGGARDRLRSAAVQDHHSARR